MSERPTREISLGKFYSRSDNPYDAVRKVIAIAGGRVKFVDGCGRIRSVGTQPFLRFAARPLADGEPVNRYAHVVTVGGQDVWHVFTSQGTKLGYWYSLHGQAIYSEPPAASDSDRGHHFDVRTLPAEFRAGLQIDLEGSHPPINGWHCMAPLDRFYRERAAHVAAIARALAAGFDIRAHERELYLDRLVSCSKPLPPDEEIPF